MREWIFKINVPLNGFSEMGYKSKLLNGFDFIYLTVLLFNKSIM